MPASFSIVPLLYLLGAAHGVFLALALFMHKGATHRANVYLGLYTLVFVAALVDYFIDETGLDQSLIALRVLIWPKEFLYGILVYFYTRELTQPGEFLLRRGQWWHFLPLGIHVLATWPLLLFAPEVQHAVLYDSQAAPSKLIAFWSVLLGPVELWLTVAQITVYLSMSLLLIHRHRLRVLQAFSYNEDINLTWLRNLLVGTLVVYLIWLAEEFIHFEGAVNQALDAALGLSMVVLIYSMSFLGLRQVAIFGASNTNAKDGPTDPVLTQAPASEALTDIELINDLEAQQQSKYRNSALTGELCEALMFELESLMRTDRPYRDGTLSLPQLADQLGISANYLSQVINQQAGQNFFDYVNRYRVEEVKERIRAGSQEAVLGLATEAGFNSKSAFYNAFRKNTGKTPSQFKRSLEAEN